VRKHSPLPEGYTIVEARSLRLFDAQGNLIDEVAGSPDARPPLEARAWQDAWQGVESELREDLRALREGIRPLEDLRRLRQYMRMLDAIERAPSEAQERAAHARAVRRRAVGGFALAAAAAAIAVFVTSTRFGPIESVSRNEPASPAAGTQDVRQAGQPATAPAATSVEPKTSPDAIRQARARSTRRPSFQMPRPSAPVRGDTASSPRTQLSGYAVSFGEFATRTTAEGRMHLIRAKGYIVYVAEVGDSYLVVTRPYRTRAQADRLANALQEIGLPAMTQIAGTYWL
jgi:cell division septation protein DedD